MSDNIKRDDKTLEEEDVNRVLETVKPKIKKSLNNTTPQDRDDLEQELALKIIEKKETMDFSDVPGFWEFINLKSNA
ncbi:hypothetical protein J2S78_002758 [Salibacterium salarium]|uniref:hypothetical protein n=1 Tax=Salibacterium salarium TaxID=284579 RepID=UPI002789F49A|nr:hypothetical protein [Salibacterium salarium]MDQ0300311.1 hypothetical protein [Salibacterium salarium]